MFPLHPRAPVNPSPTTKPPTSVLPTPTRAPVDPPPTTVPATETPPTPDSPITMACFYGAYEDSSGNPIGPNNPMPPPTDSFLDFITYFFTGFSSGEPSTRLAGFQQPESTLTVSDPVNTGLTFGDYTIWSYTATHTSVDVKGGREYWIKIENSVNDDNGVPIPWFWQGSDSGDKKFVQTGVGFVFGEDLAFCLDVEIQKLE